MVTSDIVKRVMLKELKKVQIIEQLNVSDALIEKIADQLTVNLCEEIGISNEGKEIHKFYTLESTS